MTSIVQQGRAAPALPALCARAEPHPAQQAELVRAAAAVTDWAPVLRAAEQNSLSPLLYQHLSSAEIALPTPVKRELLGGFLQHGRSNETRAAALAEMLSALEQDGIRALVLKGAALAHTVYPQPGLRPMRDLDLLVAPAGLSQARKTLLHLGYREELEASTPAGHHHIPPLGREQGGMHISVEIHHQIFPSTRHYRPLGYAELAGSAFAFQLQAQTAYTTSLEDTLWHIYRHAAGPPLLTIPFKLIYAADMISLVEKYADQIDWEQLRRKYPQVLRILPLLHFFSPWSPEILLRFGWNLPAASEGFGVEFGGWPRRPLRPDTLRDTFAPPEGWLRLFYGVGLGAPLAYHWYKWVRHPFHVFEWGISTALAGLRKKR